MGQQALQSLGVNLQSHFYCCFCPSSCHTLCCLDQAADIMVDMEALLPPQLTGIHMTSITEVRLHVIICVNNTSTVYVQSPQAVTEEQEEGE